MKRISQERRRLGLTQRQLAERLEMSVISFFQIEQGRLVPTKTSRTGQKLERFFGRRLKTLLSDL